MNDKTDSLTELEGAILGEAARLQPCTAYRLRQSFLTSRSTEWSASTGAIYPALRRLTARGLLAAGKADSRGGQALNVTPAGRAALEGWMGDAERASNPGFDPLRTRVGFARVLAADWPGLAARLAGAVEARLAEIDAMVPADDPAEAAWRGMERAAHQARLAWLRANGA